MIVVAVRETYTQEVHMFNAAAVTRVAANGTGTYVYFIDGTAMRTNLDIRVLCQQLGGGWARLEKELP